MVWVSSIIPLHPLRLLRRRRGPRVEETAEDDRATIATTAIETGRTDSKKTMLALGRGTTSGSTRGRWASSSRQEEEQQTLEEEERAPRQG